MRRAFVFVLLCTAMTAAGAEYEERKGLLLDRAAGLFADDPLRDVETDLDRRSFDRINKIAVRSDCKLLDNPLGWSVEPRTGGRPFFSFDAIAVDGVPRPFDPSCFTPGSSGIPQSELDEHFAAGKRVNRLWFTHKASGGFPIVVVVTPDGFFNAGGAKEPNLLGAVLRTGFIGEPFDPLLDDRQHAEELGLRAIDDDTVVLLYDLHSAVGEGVVEAELRWDSTLERPELRIRSAQAPRAGRRLGFAGLNFMRGPTVHGIVAGQIGDRGIEAYHDGRTAFLVHRDARVQRQLLVQPLPAESPLRQDLASEVLPGSKLVLDQPQGAVGYFSKHPDPGYEDRTDLILTLTAASVAPIGLRQAQTTVELSDPNNPEANETVNLFYAAARQLGRLDEFVFNLTLEARDFEGLHPARPQGVVFVSDRGGFARLHFLPLDEGFLPLGPAEPLTDGFVTSPRRPASSPDGRPVLFDAAESRGQPNSRIYALDLGSGAVRRLSHDFVQSSAELDASASPDGLLFALVSNRTGSQRVHLIPLASGLAEGFGNSVPLDGSSAVDWSPNRDEIVFVQGGSLQRLAVGSDTPVPLVTRSGLRHPEFSPSGESIAYEGDLGLHRIGRDGAGDRLVLADGAHPTWADEATWVVERTLDGNTDLYRVEVATGGTQRLTVGAEADIEPAFVAASGPQVEIESPADGSSVVSPVTVRGSCSSAGVPLVTVNGVTALVEAGRWSVTLSLAVGSHSLLAQVTDPATGLSARHETDLTVIPLLSSGGLSLLLGLAWFVLLIGNLRRKRSLGRTDCLRRFGLSMAEPINQRPSAPRPCAQVCFGDRRHGDDLARGSQLTQDLDHRTETFHGPALTVLRPG